MLPPAYTKLCLFLLLAAAAVHPGIVTMFDPPFPCKDWADCAGVASGTSKNASCIGGYCMCESGTTVKRCSSTDIVRNNNRSAGTLVSRSCKHNQDCKFLGNSFCNTTISRCDCEKDYVLSNAKRLCLKKAEALDFPCVEHSQCLAFLSNTTCRNGRCGCIPGYHPARYACYKTIDIGKSCTRSEECGHVNGAVCTDRGVCDCAAETVIDGDNKTCLPVAREILDNCAESVQCATSFPNALCIDGSCRCRDRYHYEPEMNRCFADKNFGDDCGNTYECYQAGDENATRKALTCAENVCICADNYLRENERCVNAGSRFLPSLMPIFIGIIVRVAFNGRYWTFGRTANL